MTTEHRQTTFLGATISRRTVLRSTVPLLGGAVLAGCTAAEPTLPRSEQGVLSRAREPLPPAAPAPAAYTFFTDDEARTVEAIVARLIPGDDEDPGALQAAVPTYIDLKLSRFDDYPDATYRQGPFAVGYSAGEEPPSGPGIVAMLDDELQQYGFQSALTPQEVYRQSIPGLDRYAQQRFDAPFADLDEAQQDELLMVLDDAQQRSETGGEEQQEEGGGAQAGQADDEGGTSGNGNGSSDEQMDLAESLFGDADPGTFFSRIYTDTIEGMFADPMYGGNRDLVGWHLVGYPGAQRSYSPQEMLHGTDKQPQAMHNLPVMNPDRAGGGRQALEQPHLHGTEGG